MICRAALSGIFSLLALVFAEGALAAPAAASPRVPLQGALHTALADYLQARGKIEHISTLSMSVSFKGDPTLLNDAIGTTKFGGGDPVTPSSLFQTGSNTKAFTSVLILRLEAKGVLSIHDKLKKWLPQYPAYGDVTLEQLMNMSSGIPSYDNTPQWERDVTTDPYEKTSAEKLIGYVYPKIKKPAAWGYSNTGYILLQMIVEKASPFHSYATELNKLIAELGLKDTYYEPFFYPPQIADRVVSGYEVNTDDAGMAPLIGKDTSRFSLGWAQAAGAMVSTPAALVRWVRMLFDGHVLQPKQQQELLSLVSTHSGEPISTTDAENPQGFALGLFQIDFPAVGRFWGYQGSTIGYRAAYAYTPANGLIVCVFTNSQAPAKESKVNTDLMATLTKTIKKYGKAG